MNLGTHALLAFLVLLPTYGMTAEPVRIGVLLSMDGPAGCLGRDAWKGIRAAYKSQPTVLGKPVQLVPANAHSEPSQAASAFFRLAEKERVCAVIGDVSASCTLAAAPVAERLKIPLVSLSGPVSPGRASRAYTIWTGISAEQLGQWCAATCRTMLSAKTVAIVQDNSQEFSVVVATCFALAFESLGGNVVYRSGVHAGQPLMGSVLERVRRIRPDALFVPLFATQCAWLADQARGMGIEAPILSTNEVSHFNVRLKGVRGEEGLYMPVPLLGDPIGSQVTSALVSQGKLHGSQACRPWEGAGTNAYLTLLQAIEQAQSLNGDAVCKNAAVLHAGAAETRKNIPLRLRHNQ